jgi:hypothetical protein
MIKIDNEMMLGKLFHYEGINLALIVASFCKSRLWSPWIWGKCRFVFSRLSLLVSWLNWWTFRAWDAVLQIILNASAMHLLLHSSLHMETQMERFIKYFNIHPWQLLTILFLMTIYIILVLSWEKIYHYCELPKSECPTEYRKKRFILILVHRALVASTISLIFLEF